MIGSVSAGLASSVALLVGAGVGFAARALGPRLGAMDHPGELKTHGQPVSFLGGIAVTGGLATGLALLGWPLPWAASAAIGGAALLGLADDYLDVPPWLRLGLQLGLGLLLAAGGSTAGALPEGAIAWIVGAVAFAAALNAVNMVDGLDGLAAGTATISALGLALIAARAGHDGPMVLALITAGATSGFLAHNLPPARLFLGDNGAYLLAGTLSVIALSEGRSWAGLLAAATCFGLFGLDLVLAILRRVSGRAKLTQGDRWHLYDQLRHRGISHRRTLAVCWALHAAMVAAGVQAAELPAGWAIATVAGAWMVSIAWLAWSGFVGGAE